MTYKAFLQTKTGEVEGYVDTVGIGFGPQGANQQFSFLSDDEAVTTYFGWHGSDSDALAHFEKHFGRIERENG